MTYWNNKEKLHVYHLKGKKWFKCNRHQKVLKGKKKRWGFACGLFFPNKHVHNYVFVK